MTQSKPVIAVEEHFVIEELDSFKDEDPNGPHAKAVAPIMNRLKNLGDNRIAEMDEAGVAKQIQQVFQDAFELLHQVNYLP